MGINRTEENLLSLLDSAPRQHNQAKLLHYVTTSRELLEKLVAETTSEGISSIAKGKLNEYSERIEELASRLAFQLELSLAMSGDEKAVETTREKESNLGPEQIRSPIALPSGLRRRFTVQLEAERPIHEKEINCGGPLRLDAATQAHIENHRKLQEDLTDEIVELACQLKDRSLMMNQSVQVTEETLDSTEWDVANSLASTGRANAQGVEVYSLNLQNSLFPAVSAFRNDLYVCHGGSTYTGHLRREIH